MKASKIIHIRILTCFVIVVIFSVSVKVNGQYITGGGTIGNIPKYTGSTAIGGSIIWQSTGDTMVGIGMTSRSGISAKLNVIKSALNSTPVFQSNISGFGSTNSIKHIFSQDGKNYGLYQSGSTLFNFFEGSVGIGVDDPLYTLDINGGIGLKDKLEFTGGENGIISISQDFTVAFRSSPSGSTYGALTINRFKTTIFDTLHVIT
jgi:hypothetical protein